MRRKPAARTQSRRATGPGTSGAKSAPELEDYLRRVVSDAEAELGQLHRHPQAWQHITAYLMEAMPVFGFSATADALLGPKTTSQGRDVIPTRELRAFRAIEQKVKRCRPCRAAIASVPDGLAEHAMVQQARMHHKKLFRQYLLELEEPIPPAILEAPAWSAAYRAATAASALRNLGSPMALFAAGSYLEQQRLLAWAARTLLPKATTHARRRFIEGIKLGHFPSLGALLVRQAYAEAAKKNQIDRAKAEEPVREAVRQEYRRLCRSGLSVTPAAHTIAANLEIRKKIQAIAEDHGVRPWRSEFYSFAAIRKIVGL